MKNLIKYGHTVSDISTQTDTHTDKTDAHCNASTHPYMGEVIFPNLKIITAVGMCMQIENMQYLNPLHSKERFLNATTLCQNRCSLGVNNSQNGLTAPK